MEFYTDYIFKDEGASQYSATISMKDVSEVIDKIVKQTATVPEYTIIIEVLDGDTDEPEVTFVRNGKILAS